MVEGSIRQAANEVAEILANAGHEVYIAGGAVRDRLLGGEPMDIDLATSALPDQVAALFPGESRTVGAHFGVVLVGRQGWHVDVATFRTDGSYSDSRHPDSVVFSTAREDACRRDFTVNGLFENPFTGGVVDFVGGRRDLDLRLIRAIGNASERFREDALRLIRAVRFAADKQFAIERDTWYALKEHAGLIRHISVERIRDEFNKILISPYRRRGVEMLVESGLMQWIIPEVLPMMGCPQPARFHPEGDVYIHTLLTLDDLEGKPSLPLALAALLHDVGKPPMMVVDATGRIRFSGHADRGEEMAVEILTRLRYPNKIIGDVAHMIGRHMDFMNVDKMRPSTLRRFMSSPVFADELALHRADCLSSHRKLDHYGYVLDAMESIRDEPVLPRPLVSGRDLIDAGYAPGPDFKDMLDLALNMQMEHSNLSPNEIIDEIVRKFPVQGS